jgi:hypothetical protein
MDEYVLPTLEGCMVSGADLDSLLEKPSPDWDDFYGCMRAERAFGDINCPRASCLATTIFMRRVLQMPYKGRRSNSEILDDIRQNLYLAIMDKIPYYDETRGIKFATYFEKFLQGIVRETRNDGLSTYQIRNKGIRVISKDELAANRTDDAGREETIEFADEGHTVEDILERKIARRDSNLTYKLITSYDVPEDAKERKNYYQELAIAKMYLGGIGGMSELVKNLIEEDLDLDEEYVK